MMITIAKIIERIGGSVVSGSCAYSEADYIDNVVTDTRLLKAGGDYSHTAFVAVRGEVFDGNDFIGPAAVAGVFLIVAGTDEEKARRALSGAGRTIIVNCADTLKAYGAIAGIWRERLDVDVVGITGSVGKTTAKEFVFKAVSVLGPAAKTPKNHNNEIGVPAAILGIGPEIKYAVIEMGMRGRGQISFLASIARPRVGIITNIGTAHLELLGTKENTRLAKLEIAEKMGKNDFLLVNGDDRLLVEAGQVLKDTGKNEIPVIRTFGFGENCFFRAGNVTVAPGSTEFDLSIGGKFVQRVSLNVMGEHYVYGALAGIGAARACGASLKDIAKKVISAVSSVSSDDTGRQQVYTLANGTLIDDCYNASPEAVRAELRILKKLAGKGRKVAFLGDMLELGDLSAEEHRSMGRACAENGVDVCVCVGRLAAGIPGGVNEGAGTVFKLFPDSAKAAEAAADIVEKGDTVLVKGSHAMHMEVISARIKELFES